MDDPVAIALDIASHFDRLGVAYLIGGSFASSVHGEPRSTNDVDFVAALDAKTGAAQGWRVQSIPPRTPVHS